MVHALAQSPRLQSGHLQERPDPARIVAYSGAIAVNAIALLLLLMPMSAPPPLPTPEAERPMTWILPEKKPVIVPVVPPQKTVPRPPRPASVHPAQAHAQATESPVLVDHGSDVVLPTVDPVVDPGVVDEAPTMPIAAVRLEYASAPPPPYPRDALRMRLSGTVVLQVLVATDGRPLDVQVQSSSGHRQLDEAARKHVLKRWRFRPAMQDGHAVQAMGLVPVAFSVR